MLPYSAWKTSPRNDSLFETLAQEAAECCRMNNTMASPCKYQEWCEALWDKEVAVPSRLTRRQYRRKSELLAQLRGLIETSPRVIMR